MSDNQRGARIQERLDALGVSDRVFHDRSGIDRKTLRRAVAGEPVRGSTYAAIESWLDKMEAAASGKGTLPQPVAAVDPQLVTFRLTGNFGIEVVVSGPVEDIDEMKVAVKDFIREMGQQPK